MQKRLHNTKQKRTHKNKFRKITNPTGWRLLVMPFRVKEKSEGGIIIAQETLDRARAAVQVGYVLKMGDFVTKTKRDTQQSVVQTQKIG